MEKLGIGLDDKGVNFKINKDKCISLLTSSLLYNSLESLEDLEATPLKLLSSIHKVYFCGCYLPYLMVGVLISVKKYLRLAHVYPGLPPW